MPLDQMIRDLVDNAATAAEGYATAFQVIGALGALAAILVLFLANPERDRKLIRAAA